MSVRRSGVILQARLGSQRLPGKALAIVERRSMLEQCLRRLAVPGVAPVVLATTDRADDDILARQAVALGVRVFRGDEHDVLERFVRCAAHFGFELVIRATADNPCVDIDAPRRVLEALQFTDADYVREDGLPHGAAVEGVTSDALVKASMLARDTTDREHVTTFIKGHPEVFRILELRAPAALARPDLRLTVDTDDDLQRVRDLYRRTGQDTPPLADLIAAADAARQSVA
jgi:spore coat polysaccharide biosynthesis protein SpsF